MARWFNKCRGHIVISLSRWATLLTVASTATAALAGGEIQPGSMPAPGRSKLPAPRSIERHAMKPIYRPGDEVSRNLPLPAPVHGDPTGNDFYGPTYYYPSAHNVYEGLHPTYYPFMGPKQESANYKNPGSYCPSKVCGASRSHWYWDSYDDWVRGGRYGQHQ